MKPPARRAPVARVSLAALALLVGALLLGALAGCKEAPAALAELVQASGPVQRGAGDKLEPDGTDDWQAAALGARFFLGDAARTADGTAVLQLAGSGSSRLDMEPHTVLRFGRRGDDAVEQRLLVELGAIEIAGGGAYQFDIGDIQVAQNGGVRITGGDGGSRVELLVGQASIRATGGELTQLEPGVALDFSDIEIRPLAADARRADAPAAVDAGPDGAAVSGEISLEAGGGVVEIQRGGGGGWQALPRGVRALEPGTQVRVTRGVVKLGSGGLTVELSKGSVAAVGADRGLAVVSGVASARAAPDAAGALAVPGGSLAFAASPRGASSDVTVGPRDSRVRATGGQLTVVGKDTRLELSRGESVLLARAGTLRVLVAVPEVHDVAIVAGDNATVHDGRGAAAVQFRFGDKCPGGGVIELDSSASFRTPSVSAGSASANLMVSAGSYAYRLRCEEKSGDGRAVQSGRLSVIKDGGKRPLPSAPPPFQLDADGRTYRVGYQGAIPAMKVVWKGATGSSFTLRLARSGKDQSFASTEPTYSIPGSKLSEGVYMVWFEKSGARSKVSTVIIDFDNTAPAIYIDEPDDGQAWGAEVVVQGAVLPGWTPSIDGVALPLDKQRRFRATVPAPTGALAIRVSHPQRGVHYYLRRRR